MIFPQYVTTSDPKPVSAREKILGVSDGSVISVIVGETGLFRFATTHLRDFIDYDFSH